MHLACSYFPCTHPHQLPFPSAPVNPWRPATPLFPCGSAFWPSCCGSARQQDKSVIDSRKPPNNLTHWFQYDQAVSIIPPTATWAGPCIPPSFLPAAPRPTPFSLSHTEKSTDKTHLSSFYDLAAFFFRVFRFMIPLNSNSLNRGILYTSKSARWM